MTEKQWKWMFNILVILVLLTCGFFIGRCTVNSKTIVTTEYVKGPTTTDIIYQPKPYKVVEPIDTLSIIQQCIKDGIYKELWPEKVVTEYVEVNKSDTTAIMRDWATKRYYSETLFSSDTEGECSIDAEIQYNRMKLVGYNFTPITKVVTETKYLTKKFEPFVGLSYLTNPWGEVKNHSIQISGGVYFKEKYGLQAIYQRGFKLKEDYIGLGIAIKF
jgi:hypothetical protein